jgi:predicted permease
MEIFKIVLPIFLIISAGFILRWKGVVKAEWVHVLNRFVYYVALPALVLVSFWEINWLDKAMLSLAGWNVLAVLLLAAVLGAVLSLSGLRAKLKAAFFLTVVVGNTVYMGFPLLGAALGRENFGSVVAAATAHLVLGLVLAALAAEFWVVKAKSLRVYVLDFVKNPLVVSLVLGGLLSLTGFRGGPADMIQKPLAMLGATASPVALFALGGFLHGRFYQAHLRLSLLSALLKLAVFPLAMLLLCLWLGLGRQGAAASALIATMPTAVTAFVIAEKYKLDEEFVANSILLSTVLSLLSIVLWLFALAF